MRTATFALVTIAALASGCLTEDSCSEYVDYMCDCHEDDPEVDCDELDATYGNADADLQEQCAIELDDQITADEDEGYECANDTGATAA